MASWLRLLTAALVLGTFGDTSADPLPPANSGNPLNFALGLLSNSDSRVPVATGAPMNLLPENLPPPRQVRPPVAAATVPLPRPRPRVDAAVLTPAVTAAIVPARLDRRTTGAVSESEAAAAPETDGSAETAETAAAEIAPAEAPANAAPPLPPPVDPAPVVLEADGLASDIDSFIVESDDVSPRMLKPQAIRPPRPPAGSDPADTAAAPVFLGQPFELVRSLQLLQDRMALGDLAALSAQHALRREIDRSFADADPALWADPRNAEAAVTYVLSGGAPGFLRNLLDLEPRPAVDETLLAAVFAYSIGDTAKAGPLFAEIDIATVPASMAGLVAIAKSALVVKSDPAEAMKLLSLARLLSTGTLIEEAALRRQLFVADQRNDEDAVKSLARQYLDRFRHSVYAGNFRARFAAAISHMRSLDREERFAQLDEILAMVEPDARCQLYLTAALASTINLRFTSARLAAERASGLALAGSTEESRARLYHAAALATLPGQADQAATDLAGVDRAVLGSSDRALFEVVSATVAGVRLATDRSRITAVVAEPLGAGAVAAERPVMKRAEAALAETAALVETVN